MLNRIAEVVLTTLLPKSDFGVKGLRMTKWAQTSTTESVRIEIKIKINSKLKITK